VCHLRDVQELFQRRGGANPVVRQSLSIAKTSSARSSTPMLSRQGKEREETVDIGSEAGQSTCPSLMPSDIPKTTAVAASPKRSRSFMASSATGALISPERTIRRVTVSLRLGALGQEDDPF
jgi:hypothetical protein